MNITRTLGRTAGGDCRSSRDRRALSLAKGASASTSPAVGAPSMVLAAPGLVGPQACSIQTSNGHNLTAAGSGGLSSGDTLHTDAARAGTWEEFHVTCGL
jgi:hypothetical protein